MTIWIDPPAWPAHGRLWSHLISDTSYAELHDFAAAQGIPRRAFEGDHYDVPEDRHADLLAAGARAVGGRELARILRDSGLRIQKRRHERVVHSVPGAPWLPVGSRADVIASRQEEPPAHTVVVRLALWQAGRLLVLQRLGGGLDLPSAPVGRLAVDDALHRLYSIVVGAPARESLRLLGYVRNAVPAPDDTYKWPVPQACFAVWTDTLPEGTRVMAGTWIGDDRFGELTQRHWWPLVAPFVDGYGPG